MSQREIGATEIPAHRSKWHRRAYVLVAFAFFLAGLSRVPVPTVDGAVRAAMARNIVVNHQLWPITYEGKVFTDHPPLFLWLTALAYKILGINDVAANIVPRLFAGLTVIVTAAIAIEAGLGEGVALGSAIILCLTRDFVLSSVRGYIEPVLELFIYLGLYFTLKQKNSRALWPAIGAGVCVWLAAFSKGPVALWPFLFYFVVLIWNGQTIRLRIRSAGSYLAAFALCTGIWALWVTSRGDWGYWQGYFFGQVLSSALEGRGGAQSLEPLFFAKILMKFYWPWLPFLLWASGRLIRNTFELDFSVRSSYAWIFFFTALGFVGGFSLMKWKFWYYIAPAYPACALLISTVFYHHVSWIVARPRFPRYIAAASMAWIALVSVIPIPLHRERVPEVMAFKNTILKSPVTGPVWFLHDLADHNMVGTSGNWYFNRDVLKISDEQEEHWQKTQLVAPAWIITGSDFWPTCRTAWCRASTLIQTEGKSSLVYYAGKGRR